MSIYEDYKSPALVGVFNIMGLLCLVLGVALLVMIVGSGHGQAAGSGLVLIFGSAGPFAAAAVLDLLAKAVHQLGCIREEMVAGRLNNSKARDIDVKVSEVAEPSKYFQVSLNGETLGPMELASILRKVKSGEFASDVSVKRDGTDEWMPLNLVTP